MKTLIAGVKRFIKDEQGVTAIEYGLIAALIAVVIIAAVATLGTNLNCVFRYIAGCLSGDNTGCTAAALATAC